MNNKKLLQWFLKLGLTIVAFYLLSKKIEWAAVKQTVQGANAIYLVIALLLYIASQIVSSYRLNTIQKEIPVHLSETKNLKLYFIGMFYNLFLPGGIGGDGYKAYYINKQFDVKMKHIISALFLDRFFGLCALFLIIFPLLMLTNLFEQLPSWVRIANITLWVLVIPVTYAIVKLMFGKFIKPFFKMVGLSLVVQSIQVLEAFFILSALHTTSNLVNYFALFLASSISSVLPISVGGVGVRELVMVYGNELLNIDKNSAVAFSLIFFIISAIASFIGAFLKVEE